jgi:WD40 repeat protein
MTDIFISYSRKDKDFVRRLHDALAAHNRDSWVDWEDIPRAADWLDEIYRGIDAADTFVYVISPDSLTSEVCNLEMAHARARNKRVIPLIRRDADEKTLAGDWFNQDWEQTARENWTALKHLNWLFFRDTDDFDSELGVLLRTMDTDLTYLKEHTRLLTRAGEWDGHGRNPAYALRGDDLTTAETWLAQSGGKDPRPTDLHTAYILASRAAQNRRQRSLLGGALVAVLVASLLAVLAVYQSRVAENNAAIANANASTATIAQGQALEQAATSQANAATARVAQGQAQFSAATAIIAQGEALAQAATSDANAATARVAQGQAQFSAATAIIAQGEALAQAATSQANAAAARAAEGTAVAERDRADLQARIANSRQLAAQALNRIADRPDFAILLSLEAYHTYDTYEARSALLSAMTSQPRLVRVLRDFTGIVTAVTLSPDGRLIAVGDEQGVIQVYNLATGQRTARLPGTDAAPVSLQFSADNQSLLVTDRGTSIVKWNLMAQLPEDWLHVADGVMGDASNIQALSPDGRILAFDNLISRTESELGYDIVLWDVAEDREIRRFAGNKGLLSQLEFSPDGQYLISTGLDEFTVANENDLSNIKGPLRLWDVKTGELAGSVENVVTTSATFSPDGQRIVALLSFWEGERPQGNGIAIYDAGTLEELQRWVAPPGSTGFIRVAFSPDGAFLAMSDVEGAITLLDATTLQLVGDPLNLHSGTITGLIFSGDSQTLVSASQDGLVALWNVSPAQSGLGRRLTDFDSAWKVAFSPDGAMLAVVRTEPSDLITLLDATSGEPVGKRLSGQTGPVDYLAFSSDGAWLAASDTNNQVIVWDVATGQRVAVQQTSTSTPPAIAFVPGSRVLAIAITDGAIQFWDIARNQFQGEPFQADGLEGLVSPSALAFSPDGQLMAAGNSVATIVLWDVAEHSQRALLQGHTSSVVKLEFSPDGTLLASASWDTTVILWDTQTGQPRFQPLTGHHQLVTDLAFNRDGSILASVGSFDSTVRLWDTHSGQPLGAPLTGHGRTANSVDFSPDGDVLVSVGREPGIIRWDLNLPALQQRGCNTANLNLTLDEWSRYIGEVPYHVTCPGSASGLRDYVWQADQVFLSGDTESARAMYEQAADWALQTNDTRAHYRLCGLGSLDGVAALVMPACERTVMLDPHYGIRNFPRGLARALQGNTQGALEDFRTFVDWSQRYDQAYEPLDKLVGGFNFVELREWVEQWITALEAGQNPFDTATLDSIRQGNLF